MSSQRVQRTFDQLMDFLVQKTIHFTGTKLSRALELAFVEHIDVWYNMFPQ